MTLTVKINEAVRQSFDDFLGVVKSLCEQQTRESHCCAPFRILFSLGVRFQLLLRLVPSAGVMRFLCGAKLLFSRT